MEEVLRFYYASPRNPIGMEGDFYTSADLDPVFGQLLARQFTQWAAEFDSFTIVELGAGKGLLARSILEHCKFPYMILERSPAMRALQEERLKDYDVRWIDELPAGITGCIFSNEFFDALPVRRVVLRDGALKEIYVTEDFEEIEIELGSTVAAANSWGCALSRLRFAERPGGYRPPLQEGQVVEINLEARHWIRQIAASIDRG